MEKKQGKSLPTEWAPLLLTLALCLSVLAKLVFTFRYGSAVHSFFFLHFDSGDQWSTYLDQGLAITSVVFLSSIWFRPRVQALVFLGAWLFCQSLLTTLLHSKLAYELAISADAAYWLLPFALIFIDRGREQKGNILLRLSIGLMLLSHGLKALWQHPLFVDYLYYFLESLSSLTPTDTQVSILLKSIGFINISIGLWVIVVPFKKLYFYLAFWGLVTALIQIPYHGEEGLYEFLLKTPYFLIPLAIGLGKAQLPDLPSVLGKLRKPL